MGFVKFIFPLVHRASFPNLKLVFICTACYQSIRWMFWATSVRQSLLVLTIQPQSFPEQATGSNHMEP